jgi:hypothetical protein
MEHNVILLAYNDTKYSATFMTLKQSVTVFLEELPPPRLQIPNQKNPHVLNGKILRSQIALNSIKPAIKTERNLWQRQRISTSLLSPYSLHSQKESHENFSMFFIDIILPAALRPWCWRSLYQKWVPEIFPCGKGGWCVRLTNLPPSCAECLEIWEPQSPGTLRACPGL